MFGNLFGPSNAGDILKAVFKTTPMGVATGAIADIFKSTGIVDDIGKLLDGAVNKPKPGGLGGVSKMVDKIIKQLEQQQGTPGGLMPMDFFQGQGGGAGGVSGGTGGRAGMAAGGGKSTMPAYGGGAKWGDVTLKRGTGAVSGALAGMAQRAIFISTLQQAIQKAATQQSFNMETSINDLWVKLSALRPQGRQDLQELEQMFHMLEGIMKQRHDMAKGVIQNIR